jgi:hypothetical protein
MHVQWHSWLLMRILALFGGSLHAVGDVVACVHMSVIACLMIAFVQSQEADHFYDVHGWIGLSLAVAVSDAFVLSWADNAFSCSCAQACMPAPVFTALVAMHPLAGMFSTTRCTAADAMCCWQRKLSLLQ